MSRYETARESARRSDGRFGTYALDEADDVDLSFLDRGTSGGFGDDRPEGPKTIGDESVDSLASRVREGHLSQGMSEHRVAEVADKQWLRYTSTPTFSPQLIADNLDKAAERQLHVGQGIWTRTCACGQTFPTYGPQLHDPEWSSHVGSCGQSSARAKEAVNAPLLPPPAAHSKGEEAAPGRPESRRTAMDTPKTKAELKTELAERRHKAALAFQNQSGYPSPVDVKRVKRTSQAPKAVRTSSSALEMTCRTCGTHTVLDARTIRQAEELAGQHIIDEHPDDYARSR